MGGFSTPKMIPGECKNAVVFFHGFLVLLYAGRWSALFLGAPTQ